MLNRSAKTATYGEDVAKIDLTLPDDLLRAIDEYVERKGETREGFLRRLAEVEIAIEGAVLREDWEKFLGPPLPPGVDFVQMIREDRDGNHGH